MMVKTALLSFLMFISGYGWSQTFPVIGQLPSTAFPVCGSTTFKQSKVPQGSTGYLGVPGCGAYPDVNPFWYTFTCYQAGTLGFIITPNSPSTDDYDWMLFDITGKDPASVFTDISLVVTGNWAGTYGITGARKGGSTSIKCGSDPADKVSTFSAMPTLIKGHKYLLIVSHFTQTQSGYSLSFTGGTAVITDPSLPHLLSASVSCDAKTITVLLNKQMRCNSLSPNGSDFDLASSPGIVAGATGVNCNNGFDMTSIVLSLNTALVPGNYSLTAKNGTDGNTLLDDCGADVPVGEAVSFTVLPPHPTPFDSLTIPTCAPNMVQLVFSDPIQCSTIAPNGSDFTITGNPAVTISGAAGVCVGGLSNIIHISFNSPLVKQGDYQISLVSGTDGNTIINECGVSTPAGGQLSFHVKDTVSAVFDYQIIYGCRIDTIALNYQAANGVNEWIWNVDPEISTTQMDPRIPETVFSTKNVQHIVTNGFCSDTATLSVNLDNALKSAFNAPDIVCPKTQLSFSNISIGNVVAWNWDFGDGTSSSQKDPPPHLYPDTWAGKNYTVTLVVENDKGCYDSSSENITKLQSCYITVPNAFTPNGDGNNDFLYPLNAYMATDLEFRVYNRFGQMVFETKEWTHKWDGTIGGKPQGSGTFVWTLQYTDSSSGKRFSTRGTSVLIR
jgi:gliding motility-associated-like protein